MYCQVSAMHRSRTGPRSRGNLPTRNRSECVLGVIMEGRALQWPGRRPSFAGQGTHCTAPAAAWRRNGALALAVDARAVKAARRARPAAFPSPMSLRASRHQWSSSSPDGPRR
jgi:hypothetical protein